MWDVTIDAATAIIRVICSVNDPSGIVSYHGDKDAGHTHEL